MNMKPKQKHPDIFIRRLSWTLLPGKPCRIFAEKLMPEWFIDTAALNKLQLLELAKNGGAKPPWKTKLGRALSSYTSKSSDCYDKDFTAEIKALRPDWFIDTAALNKLEIIKLAKSGGARPSQKTKLGRALSNYTTGSHDSSDKVFTAEIKALRPDWFRN